MPSSKPSVLVAGAGMVGVCSAFHLAQRGHRVILVDRKAPGRETSYGNLGVIQREAVAPYAFPRSWKKMIEVGLGRSTDVAYQLTSLPRLLVPLARYWWASAPARHARISGEYNRLIARCLDEHEVLMRAAGADDLVRRGGFRAVFRSTASFDLAVRHWEELRQRFGVRFRALSTGDIAAAEPALDVRPLAGGLHWEEPWSVSDPGDLVQRYARAFERAGGHIAQADAMAIARHGQGWRLRDGSVDLSADQLVIALGPWSPTWAARWGYRFPAFVKRGYHRHYRCAATLNAPVLDADAGFGLATMSRGLRLTTGAELASQDAPPSLIQLQRVERLASEVMELGAPVESTPWLGSRPCTPDMKPVIGPAPGHRGLWFNFGHAHQGFTLGPVSGRLIAELLGGEPPVLDPSPYLPSRFA